MPERQSVESTRSSSLAMCSCGWRTIFNDPGPAWAAAAAHGLHAHPGDNTRHAYKSRRNNE